MAIGFSHTQYTLGSAVSQGIGVETFLHVWVSEQYENETEDSSSFITVPMISVYRKHKINRGRNIFAIFAGTITPRKYSPRIVHHVILVTLDFAIDSLWNIVNAALLPDNPWRQFTRPQGTTTYHTNPTTGHRTS